MRALIVITLLSLAACGDKQDGQPRPVDNVQQPSPDNAIPVATPIEVPSAPTPVPSAPVIPAFLRGEWTGLADRCDDASAELALTLAADRLVFHESVGTVRAVEPIDGGYAVQADFTGEGQNWTRRIVLRPIAEGTRLVVVNDGVDVARKRCGA